MYFSNKTTLSLRRLACVKGYVPENSLFYSKFHVLCFFLSVAKRNLEKKSPRVRERVKNSNRDNDLK